MSYGEHATGKPKDTPYAPLMGDFQRPSGMVTQSMKKLDRAATVRERLRQSAGLPLRDGRDSDFCYFRRRTERKLYDIH